MKPKLCHFIIICLLPFGALSDDILHFIPFKQSICLKDQGVFLVISPEITTEATFMIFFFFK